MVGITPTAPWILSLRAASRSEFCSSQWSYADPSAALAGSADWSVRKSRAPHGLIVCPIVPASMAGHSSWTTERA